MVTLDRDTILAVSALISLVLGTVLLAAQVSARLGSWARCWGAGTVALGVAGADQAFRGILPDAWLVSSGNVVAIAGYALIVQGARLLAGRRPHWAAFASVTALAVIPLIFSNAPDQKAARVAYNNALMIVCDLWVVVEAIRLARGERLGTAWIMAVLFAAALPFSLVRFAVATATVTGHATLDSAKVGTWLAALLAAFWSLRGALPALLIAERSSRNLTRLAYRDGLTDALNRVGFERFCATLDTPATAILMDLDHFKALNDRYGHARGDEVLRMFADVASAHRPDDGAFVRLGGDEFALVLPGVSGDAARRIAETIRSRFSAALAPLGLAAPTPTVSIGIATSGLARIDISAVLSQADQAMYLSKNAGRDRVSVQALAA